ncbi:MAG: electron transfer flavoprotein subunit beta/FixA family protein [Chloroherpetonaceae bacterium]|nr:electron transfer flavoprotein subunit beta/FixA family protein [Chthonomonadaceae bacterium]MDW8208619.1 electron transfer flavoprotein subunit beta/FixA family protein [Chloroherpetonaceae bacterium]
MKILVPIKRVPDPYGRVRLTPGGHVDETDIKWVINPFDEIALEEAIRLREAGHDIEILAVAIGTTAWEEQLRTALAMGADRALLIQQEAPADPGRISHYLAAIARQEQPQIILMGKQAIDDDCNQTGQRLAALLQIPQATFASRIELTPDGTCARVTREVDTGRETIEVTLPAVITADLRLNEPRYVALPAIIKARSKPLLRIDAAQLQIPPTAPVTTLRLETPPPRRAGRRVGSVDELITALREEARVI